MDHKMVNLPKRLSSKIVDKSVEWKQIKEKNNFFPLSLINVFKPQSHKMFYILHL